jgi:hypothetical protein
VASHRINRRIEPAMSLLRPISCAFALTVLALSPTALVAQSPELRVTPFVTPGQAVDLVLFGPANASSLILFDVSGGPSRFLDQTYFLGLSSAFGVLDAGPIGSGGFRTARFPVGASAPIGTPLYLQGLVVDFTDPSPLRVSDGESCVVWANERVLIEDFRDPVAMGLGGSFDASVRGRVQAAPARTRIVGGAPVGGTVFSQPLHGPLDPNGVRAQSVFRAADLQSTGEPELVVAIRWRPEAGLVRDVLHNVAIDLAHSHVTPDYTVDPWSALPRAPNSGLGLDFAGNVRPGSSPQRVFQGDYVIDPGQRRADGYMPFPGIRPFAWNGIDSLLVDFRTPHDPAANGANGLRVYLMVLSSPQPNARVIRAGHPGSPVDPYGTTMAQLGDNTYYDFQFELVRVESVAFSRWIPAPVAQIDWQSALVSSSRPAGSGIAIDYRSARDAFGQTASAWSANLDDCDGKPFLQYRIRFTVTPGASVLPSVDQIVLSYL